MAEGAGADAEADEPVMIVAMPDKMDDDVIFFYFDVGGKCEFMKVKVEDVTSCLDTGDESHRDETGGTIGMDV